MKGALAAAVILGAVAIGGVPALALTLAADEYGSASTTSAWQPGDGAPPWSNGTGARADKADKRDDPDGSRADEGEKRGNPHTGQLPPGLVGKEHHGAKMRDWAHCVADAEKPSDDVSPPAGEKTFDPEQACGTRPAPPGRAKHERR